ncbi:hypothetical protein B0H14DRAFT_2801233, partial [Mycena olivaceomarginata]
LSQLYPCGESASEFQMLLKKYPLQKPQFDCAHLDDTYDCGCGDKPLGNNPDRIPKPDPMDSRRDGDEGGMMWGGK